MFLSMRTEIEYKEIKLELDEDEKDGFWEGKICYSIVTTNFIRRDQ